MGITVDVDALRDYLQDYAGSAAFSGFPGAMVDVIDADSLDARSLCRKAERMGLDLRDFAVDEGGEDGEDGEYGEDEYEDTFRPIFG